MKETVLKARFATDIDDDARARFLKLRGYELARDIDLSMPDSLKKSNAINLIEKALKEVL